MGSASGAGPARTTWGAPGAFAAGALGGTLVVAGRRLRTLRTFVVLLGALGLAALAPSLALARVTSGGQATTGTGSGVISGTVTNSADQPVSGVEVSITSLTTGYDYYATSASDGTYMAGGLPTGTYDVQFLPVTGQNYVYQYYPDKSNSAAAQAVSVTTGQTTPNINASLATGAAISGKVTAAATGAPVSGATIYVRDLNGNYPGYVANSQSTTDSNGSWSVVGLPTGTYQVQFTVPNGSNYGSQYYNDATGEDPPTPVTLTAGTTTSNIDAALAAGGQISGTVTDGMTRAPAAGVGVSAVDQSGEQWSYTTTDSNGDYTLSGLSPSATYRVEFVPSYPSPLATEFYSGGSTLTAATPVSVTVGQTTANIDETLERPS